MVCSDGFLNHHSEILTFFSAKISCIFLKNRHFTKFWRLQNLLRRLRSLLRRLQNLLNSTSQDAENLVKKQEKVMVFLNHHHKPSLLKQLMHKRLDAKVMDCGYFSLFVRNIFLSTTQIFIILKTNKLQNCFLAHSRKVCCEYAQTVT